VGEQQGTCEVERDGLDSGHGRDRGLRGGQRSTRPYHVPAGRRARTGNKQVMHRARQPWTALILALMASLAGCAMIPAQSRSPQAIRSIFVREPEGSLTEELRRCGEAAHDSAVRRLRSLGYQDATEEAGADATLEGVWMTETGLSTDGRPRVTLRLVLRSRRGDVCFTDPGSPRHPAQLPQQGSRGRRDRTEAIRAGPGAPCPLTRLICARQGEP
jgi:hypothetical protein